MPMSIPEQHFLSVHTSVRYDSTVEVEVCVFDPQVVVVSDALILLLRLSSVYSQVNPNPNTNPNQVYYATASRAQYVSEMITLACGGLGCDETILVETFTTCTTAELRQGKKAWEGKSDKSLVDYLSSQLGSDYDGLRTLLLKMLKGDVSTADSADDAKAAEQAATLHAELEDTG